MKKSIIVEVISLLLVLLFVYTGVIKITSLHAFHMQLVNQPLTEKYASYLMILIPLTEMTIAAFLLIPRFRNLGLYASLVLMSTFTMYVAYMIYLWPHSHLPCSCGGVIKQLSWRQHLVFNSIFVLLSLAAVLLNRHPTEKNGNASTIIYG